jgi:hypothetical protein
MDVNDIDSVSFSRDGFPPHVKSPIIWGNKGSIAAPLCYLTQPKSMGEKEWNDFLDGFHFEIRRKA